MAGRTRKQLGAWYTPQDLVDRIVDSVVDAEFVERRIAAFGRLRVLDPACGDGRFLEAAAARVRALGYDDRVEMVGVDIDAEVAEATSRRLPGAQVVCADALEHAWPPAPFDLVLGNPPFLSQLASGTTRGGASSHGGGPYADAAVEFLALSARLVDERGGRVALVLPQSVLSARDAGPVRASIDRRAAMLWSWWAGERVFDAQVFTCAVAFEFHPTAPDLRADDGSSRGGSSGEATDDGATDDQASSPGAAARGQQRRSAAGTWSHVVADRTGMPVLPGDVATRGTLGDRARLNANFRDEYYGMVPAVGDHPIGPPLVTSGLIDPGCSWWGRRSIVFARTRYERPRVDVNRLDERMQRWAAARLVPKVLVANQTRIVEAVCDPDGSWLPAVPVIAIYPDGGDRRDGIGGQPARVDPPTSPWEIAAVLTSPYASAWVWHRSAGTGLSADTVRLGPVLLAGLPWPDGELGDAVEALRAGDVRSCGRAVLRAVGIDETGGAALTAWWAAALERIEARHPPAP